MFNKRVLVLLGCGGHGVPAVQLHPLVRTPRTPETLQI